MSIRILGALGAKLQIAETREGRAGAGGLESSPYDTLIDPAPTPEERPLHKVVEELLPLTLQADEQVSQAAQGAFNYIEARAVAPLLDIVQNHKYSRIRVAAVSALGQIVRALTPRDADGSPLGIPVAERTSNARIAATEGLRAAATDKSAEVASAAKEILDQLRLPASGDEF